MLEPESTIISKSIGCNPVNITADTPSQTLTCQATNAGGNSIQSITIKKDSLSPTISSVQQGKNFAFGKSNIAPDFHCYDSISGIYSCTANITKLDTDTVVGLHSYIVTAKDKARNIATQTITYNVLGWTIKGFQPPIKNNDNGKCAENVAKTGHTIPLK
jgi:hypothetical protein